MRNLIRRVAPGSARWALLVIIPALTCVCGALTAIAGGRQAALTSPAIDPELFREGEVKRGQAAFGAWTAVCDEVPRLHQRFCSLLASFRGPQDQSVADMIVSTGDNGKPAALIRVAPDAFIGAGVRISVVLAQPPAGKKPPQPVERKLGFVGCDDRGCLAIWSISGADINALNAGAMLRLRLERLRAFGPFTAAIAAPDRRFAIEVELPGAGFPQAVAATLK